MKKIMVLLFIISTSIRIIDLQHVFPPWMRALKWSISMLIIILSKPKSILPLFCFEIFVLEKKIHTLFLRCELKYPVQYHSYWLLNIFESKKIIVIYNVIRCNYWSNHDICFRHYFIIYSRWCLEDQQELVMFEGQCFWLTLILTEGIPGGMGEMGDTTGYSVANPFGWYSNG